MKNLLNPIIILSLFTTLTSAALAHETDKLDQLIANQFSSTDSETMYLIGNSRSSQCYLSIELLDPNKDLRYSPNYRIKQVSVTPDNQMINHYLIFNIHSDLVYRGDNDSIIDFGGSENRVTFENSDQAPGFEWFGNSKVVDLKWDKSKLKVESRYSPAVGSANRKESLKCTYDLKKPIVKIVSNDCKGSYKREKVATCKLKKDLGTRLYQLLPGTTVDLWKTTIIKSCVVDRENYVASYYLDNSTGTYLKQDGKKDHFDDLSFLNLNHDDDIGFRDIEMNEDKVKSSYSTHSTYSETRTFTYEFETGKLDIFQSKDINGDSMQEKIFAAEFSCK